MINNSKSAAKAVTSTVTSFRPHQDEYNSMNSHYVVVPGNPKAFPRRGMPRGRLYNPYVADRNKLRLFLTKELQDQGKQVPLIAASDPCNMALTFRMHRPDDHFVGGNRENEIKDLFVDVWPPTPNVGNMTKFALDAAEGVLYANNRQVLDISEVKVYDNSQSLEFGNCNGMTEILVKKISLEELKRINYFNNI
jgi:hypothetical protein